MNTQIFRIVLLLLFTATFSRVSAQKLIKYPYVQDSYTIVSRDDLGGVRSEFLLSADEIQTLTTTNPSYVESDPYNKVSPKFQVARSIAANNVAYPQGQVSYVCKSYKESTLTTGWRVPTQRELMLISIFCQRNELKINIITGNFWSGTQSSLGTNQGWYLSQTSRTAQGEIKAVNIGQSNLIRCVKDL